MPYKIFFLIVMIIHYFVITNYLDRSEIPINFSLILHT